MLGRNLLDVLVVGQCPVRSEDGQPVHMGLVRKKIGVAPEAFYVG